ncbi:MAG TPA: hypothetical protein VKN99_16725 [Polyangia bacterium]|nr:hypothetical protein [Polyangia bacterium]
MEFFSEIPIEAAQAEAMARGLFAVARADGVHERELALIASFYAEVGGSARGLSELERSPAISPADLAAALHTRDERQLFVKTALLLAWADGEVSAAERKQVAAYADALGVGKDEVGKLEESVKDFLLGHLSHLHNVDATRKVAGKLKM